MIPQPKVTITPASNGSWSCTVEDHKGLRYGCNWESPEAPTIRDVRKAHTEWKKGSAQARTFFKLG